MQNRVLNIGYVTGLDYRDLSIRMLSFRKFSHIHLCKLLTGGKMIRYGAAIAAGGWHAMPRTYADRVLIVGTELFECRAVKGIHSAIRRDAGRRAILMHCWKATIPQRL